MSNALQSGVTGMAAHQQMIDVAGNNLANTNTTAFKSSRVTFSDLLSQTVRQASAPTEAIGGTNPLQVGSGVQLASVDRQMDQGTLTTTGNPLDMAIDGEGYFTVHDGEGERFTRVGTFAVDADNYLVDPSTGYRVQRIGTTGEADGYQDPSDSGIQVPYDTALPAQATSIVQYNGNLSSDDAEATTNLVSSGLSYTVAGSTVSSSSLLSAVDHISGGSLVGAQLVITGTDNDGSVVDNSGAPLTVTAGTTMQDLLDEINSLYSGATASLYNGEIRLTDDAEGYSLTDLRISQAGGAAGTLELPDHFTVLEAGGASARNTNIEIFDSQGVSHALSGAFVKTDTENMWDFVVTGVTGGVELVDRRIQGITFQANGAYGGLDETIGDSNLLQVRFAHDPLATVDIAVELGTPNEYDGLTQFGGSFTVAPDGQDGYSSGTLASVAVTRDGTLQGVFTNGIRRDLAALKMSVFQNPAALEALGGNYFVASANSGVPSGTTGQAGGAGSVFGGSLESSNVDVAAEFVNLIQAQNGYQVNARTIKVSNEMLQELTNIIR